MYVWNARKQKSKQHILASDGKTFCQIEKTGHPLTASSPEKNPNKTVCQNCKILFEEQFNEPRVSVLMGERI